MLTFCVGRCVTESHISSQPRSFFESPKSSGEHPMQPALSFLYTASAWRTLVTPGTGVYGGETCLQPPPSQATYFFPFRKRLNRTSCAKRLMYGEASCILSTGKGKLCQHFLPLQKLEQRRCTWFRCLQTESFQAGFGVLGFRVVGLGLRERNGQEAHATKNLSG